MHPERERKVEVANPLKTRQGYLTFGVRTWGLVMVVGVVGVGLALHETVGAFIFVACLLTAAVVFWLWVFRRFVR